MEEVSYPDPVEDETVFYDCHLEPEQLKHMKVHHLEVANSNVELPVFGKSWCIPIDELAESKEKQNNDILKLIDDKKKQQHLQDIDPNNYEDSLQWCNQPYRSKKMINKPFHLSINLSLIHI